jgi:hypothetical protein
MLVLELLGQLGLADLALVALDAGPDRVLGVQVADQLHRQRRAALHIVLGLQVLDRGADDALEVDALVVEEAAVLDGHRRVAHDLRDLAAGDRRAQDVGADEAQAAAVGGVDDRRGALVLRLDLVQRRAGVGDRDDPADGAERREGGERRQHAEGEEEGAGRAALVATPAALSFAAGHVEERTLVGGSGPPPRACGDGF